MDSATEKPILSFYNDFSARREGGIIDRSGSKPGVRQKKKKEKIKNGAIMLNLNEDYRILYVYDNIIREAAVMVCIDLCPV